MHNNYYLLRQLSAQLKNVLDGFTLVSCFSQDKDELIIEFNNAKKSFFVKCSLLPDLQCLSFPGSFRRARKNSIDLFPEIVMKPVAGIRQFNNERSFGLQLGDDFVLIFKMHGNQANVVLFKGQHVVGMFRNNLASDRELEVDEFDREIDWTEATFREDPTGARTRFVTFGKPVWKYLDDKGYAAAGPEKQWELIMAIKRQLENPSYSIVKSTGKLALTLLPTQGTLERFTDPVSALNYFFPKSVTLSAFLREKATLSAAIKGRLKQCEHYLEKTRERLKELDADRHYTYWADLLMANLHRASVGMTEVTFEDFHEPGKQVIIKLKPALSPQKNAEIFYRKAKNQVIEKKKLLESEALKEKEFQEWSNREKLVMQARDRDALEPVRSIMRSKEKEKERVALPYHEHGFAGFKILVGKNAESNDELTLHHAHKEDLWLHAKDVAGSHVVIRHQAGKNFPKDVVAFAASLAAYYSKRRNDSLCPVAVTPAKYVRKRKGDPPGRVIVQREDIVMAVPYKEAAK